MKKFLRYMSFIITLLLVFLLLLSSVTAYINPAKLSFFALAGFGFHFLFLINLLYMIWLAIRKRWWFCIILVSLLVNINNWNNVFQFSGKQVNEEHELHDHVKILSYNTHMFDYYNNSETRETPDIIYDFVLKQEPDIICFQEFYSNVTKPKHNPSYIFSRFKQYQYKHIEYVFKSHSGSAIATFSKYPIDNKGEIRFNSTNNLSIYTDINVKGKMIRIFNNHLESTGVKDNDIEAFDNFDFNINETKKRGIKSIAKKLKKASALRANQAETLANHISNSPYPVVVCGDFNDTPVSYVYRTMRGNLNDAFRSSGSGFGGTYNGKLPSFRIDYILYSKQFDAYNFKKFNFDYSDHFPIMTTIEIK